MKLEEKFILELIRKNRILCVDNSVDIDTEYIINFLIKHKIFIHYYDLLVKSSLFNMSNIEKIKSSFVENRVIFMVFFKKLLSSLKEHRQQFMVYKGYPLEKIIYNDFKRQFGDIDVILKSDFKVEEFKEIIKNNFDCYDESDVFTDFLGESKLKVFFMNKTFIIEIKTKNHFYREFDFDKNMYLNIDHDINVLTFNYDFTFIQLVSYFYEFTENIAMIKEPKKCKLQYAVDLYNYLKINIGKINFKNVLEYTIKYKIVHKMRTVLINLYNLFLDDFILQILKYFPKNKIKYTYDDIIDIGRIEWNISIVDRFFHYEEITQHIEKFSLGSFWLSDNNRNIYKNDELEIKFIEKIVKFKFNITDEVLSIKFLNDDFFVNETIIFINLYGYRKNKEYINPFIPITIRNDHGKNIISRKAVSYRCNYDLNDEDLLNIELQDYVHIIKKNNGITIDVLLKKLPHELDINNYIGINIMIFKIKDGKIESTSQLKTYYEKPLIINEPIY